MSIFLNAPIRQLHFRGHDDPALPAGIWWGSGTIVGDASGGQQFIRFLFGEEGEPLSGDIFNLEQMSSINSTSSLRNAFLCTVGMAPAPGLPAFDRIWHVPYQDLGSGLGNSAFGEQALRVLPLFLGSRRGGAEAVGALDIGTANLTASDSVSVSVMGYRWTGRSVMTEGGPQRPLRSLFGS